MAGNKVALVLAVLCATIASVIVYQTLKNNSKTKVVEVPKVQVVVAKNTIPARSQVNADQVELRMVPKETVNKDIAVKISDVTGRITKAEIIQGEPVNLNRLVKDGERLGLSFMIPAGMRAITVPVNEVSGVAGFIKPGEQVDLIGTLEPKDSAGGTVSWTVVQNATVLAVAQDMGQSIKDDKKENNGDKAKEDAKIGSSITLAVTPAQAQKIALTVEKGTLRLTLRPVLPESEQQLIPVKESNLITGFPVVPAAPRPVQTTKTVHTAPPAPPQPQPAAAKGRKIEIISGGKSQIITVD